MESEYSLPCLQDSATGLILKNVSQVRTLTSCPVSLNYRSIYAYSSQLISSLRAFRPEFCMHFSSPQCVLYVPPISLSFILSS